MKTKPKLKPRARRMFANYYPEIVCVHYTRKSAGASGDPSYPQAIPVAVIPLDDPAALVEKATDAFLLEHCGPISCILEDRMRSALAAIGVLPRQRKGGAK